MKKVIHRASERGKGEHGWLSTRYSFSFADWYDPSRMGFGALRVINDDRIVAKSGFGAHSHKDMEIATYVMAGTLTHKDSLGNVGTIRAGEVQVMSAGTGVTHAEYNDGDEELRLFQIWIEPSVQGAEPRYAELSVSPKAMGKTVLVSPFGGGDGLHIHQDAYISIVTLDADAPYAYELEKEGNGIYLLVIDGEADVAGERLSARDALGIEGESQVRIETEGAAQLLVIEVPMRSRE